jgi:hypothetical protein
MSLVLAAGRRLRASSQAGAIVLSPRHGARTEFATLFWGLMPGDET